MTEAERRVVLAVTCVLLFGACMRDVHERWPRAVPFAAIRTTAARVTAPSRAALGAPAEPRRAAQSARDTSDARATAARIDVNTAAATALMSLPGIGPAKAQAIIAERTRGRFASPEDLLRVRGIGPATLRRLRPLIKCSRIVQNATRGVPPPPPLLSPRPGR